MDVNKTYCGDHFTVSANITSLRCTLEINIMIYVSIISQCKKKKVCNLLLKLQKADQITLYLIGT